MTVPSSRPCRAEEKVLESQGCIRRQRYGPRAERLALKVTDVTDADRGPSPESDLGRTLDPHPNQNAGMQFAGDVDVNSGHGAHLETRAAC